MILVYGRKLGGKVSILVGSALPIETYTWLSLLRPASMIIIYPITIDFISVLFLHFLCRMVPSYKKVFFYFWKLQIVKLKSNT